MSRRDFLGQTATAAFCASGLLKYGWAEDPQFVIAETSFGKIRGTANRGIKIFKGVPYGANTEGANRFMPAPQREVNILKPAPGPSIFQALGVPGDKNPGQGEDCLVLNVWTSDHKLR